jgi:hypothetical protein
MAPKNSKTPFYLIDTQSPFYRPLWLRATICVSVVLWAALETLSKQPFWAVIAISAAVYCIYVLFVTYTPPADPVAAPPGAQSADDDDADNEPPPR